MIYVITSFNFFYEKGKIKIKDTNNKQKSFMMSSFSQRKENDWL